MTVLIAALVLFILFGLVGHRLGAIRGLVSLVGLVLAAALAFRLAPLVAPIYTSAGITNPLFNWFLPPVTVFLLVNLVFGILAFMVHGKVSWFYKYKATDALYLAWQRLNARLGICVGVFVGAVYLVLLAMIVMAAGYLTYQLASSDPSKDPPALQWLNRVRDDIQATGMDKALAAIDPTPPQFYAAADLLGILYQNPPAQSRLGSYPAMLSLAEKPEIKDLANDAQFNELLMTRPALDVIINHPKVQAVFANADTLKSIYALSPPDMLMFITNGTSAIYDSEPVLGRWQVDPGATVRNAIIRNPKFTATEQRRLKLEADALAGASLIATPEKQLIFRAGPVNLSAQWAGAAGHYSVALDLPRIRQGKPNVSFDDVAIENNRLVLRSTRDDYALVFSRVY
ncbi:MAG: CvpA family protein [Verrucomicrobia bacterium]|nr:CvpA family protein [Verrucomicrobiota bacterium]